MGAPLESPRDPPVTNPTSNTAAPVDGRRLRAARNRDAVVDALLALYDEGHLRPGAALVAERAGVSQSTVFRAFDDLDALVEVAIDHQWSRLRTTFRPPDVAGDVMTRITALARQRVAICDAAGPAMRAARLLSAESPALVATFAARRDLLRRQVEHHFAAELDRVTDRLDRRALVDALDAATSLEHVEYLRVDRALGVDRSIAALALELAALLATVPPDPSSDPAIDPATDPVQEDPR